MALTTSRFVVIAGLFAHVPPVATLIIGAVTTRSWKEA